MNDHDEIWAFVERHLQSIFNGDWETYKATTADDLSLYEYWIIPHRQGGLEFHQFMIENRWSGEAVAQRFDLFEKRCQHYGDTAVVLISLCCRKHSRKGCGIATTMKHGCLLSGRGRGKLSMFINRPRRG